MKRLRLTLIWALVLGVLGYAAGVAVAYLVEHSELTASFTSQFALIGAGIGLAGGLVLGLTAKIKDDKKKNDNTGTTTSGEKTDIAFDSKFMTEESLKANKNLVATTWDELPHIDKTGFVFRHKINHGRYEINMKPESHALVIGTTGTGKTQLLADPSIRILAHSKEKPSLVMTDPKGELYEDNAEILKQEGYKIIVLNLNDPYSSSKWNPMEGAFKLYERAGKIHQEVKKISHVTPESCGYKRLDKDVLNGIEYGDTWYGFERVAYPTVEMLKNQVETTKRQMESEAKDKLKNIALALVPDNPQAKEKTWDDGSRDFISGIMTAMLEDSRDPELGMTLDKFNFFNLYRIMNVRDPIASDRENPLKTLSAYADGRDEIEGNVKALMQTICGAPPTTQKSFLSTLGASVGKILGDEGILYMTSGTDIDFEDLAKQPTAFFIRIPDHRTERHPLGVLCISQLYTALVDVANKTVNPKNGKTGALLRPVYFILDEFGNMPAVPGFGTMVTVSRSRRIFFEIILQSYSQLDIKYGQDEAKNIKGNFQTELFLGCEDMNTIQAFSDACGEITVFHEEENKSRNSKHDDQGETISISTQRTRRPLIDKQELRQLPQWTIVAKLFRESIMKDTMTPFFDNKFLVKNRAPEKVGYAEPLDFQKIYYDIKKRNALKLKQTFPSRPSFF